MSRAAPEVNISATVRGDSVISLDQGKQALVLDQPAAAIIRE
jgi:hypothetical protein